MRGGRDSTNIFITQLIFVLMSLSRYYHTVRYLKFEQLFFQIFYKLCARIRRLLGSKEKYVSYKHGNEIKFLPFPEKRISYKGDTTFEFLNLSHKFNGMWNDRSLGDLWRYNLNYMDFILQPGMDVRDALSWIMDFIDAVPKNTIATDPYPISLRGMNWIKFLSMHRAELSMEQLFKIESSLYSQYRILYKRTERHLLANHYLENGFSLLFAAVYFHDTAFGKKAKHIVGHQLKEQIMNDGAHYELSPMYHCIILERILDCCNLLHNVDDTFFDGLSELRLILREKASRMLSWLDAIVLPGDNIPLLNDSANGVSLSPEELRGYAKSIGLEWGLGELGDSGYRHVIRPDYVALLDMAPLGASYNLGHAHADSSTFLLWVNGRELIADTGTSTYNSGKQRDYERSTRAHNTVVVDNENSSNVWGAFRCAQRAQTIIKEDGPIVYAMEHNGYCRKGVKCNRRFVCNENSFEIEDCILSKKQSKAEAFFHLSPEVQVISVDDNRVVTDRAVFVFEGHSSLHLSKVNVAYEYNLLSSTQCIKVRFADRLRTIINGFGNTSGS